MTASKGRFWIETKALESLITSVKEKSFHSFTQQCGDENDETFQSYYNDLKARIDARLKSFQQENELNYQKDEKICSTLMEEALNKYKSEMETHFNQSKLSDDKEMGYVHNKCQKLAIDLFFESKNLCDENIFIDYEKKLRENILQAFKGFKINYNSVKNQILLDIEKAIKASLDIYSTSMEEIFKNEFLTTEQFEEKNKKFRIKSVNHLKSLTEKIKDQTLLSTMKQDFDSRFKDLFVRFDEKLYFLIQKKKYQFEKEMDKILSLYSDGMKSELEKYDWVENEKLEEINESVLKVIPLESKKSNDEFNEYIPKLKKRINDFFENFKTKNEKNKETKISEAEKLININIAIFNRKMRLVCDKAIENSTNEKSFRELHTNFKKQAIDEFMTQNTIKNKIIFQSLINKLSQNLDEEFEKHLNLFRMTIEDSESKYNEAFEIAKKLYIKEMDKHFSEKSFIRPRDLEEFHEQSEKLAQNKLIEISPFNRVQEKFRKKFNQSVAIIYEHYKKLNLSNLPTKQAVGIDLGTTYSCVGVVHKDNVILITNEYNSKTTPSYVSYANNGEVTVGQLAKEDSYSNPANTLYDSKRMIGRKLEDLHIQNDKNLWPFEVITEENLIKIKLLGLKGRSLFPEEISAKVLSKLKIDAEKYLGYKVDKAVITVPAYFNDAQRQATKDAAAIAGLHVLQILNEPTAAAIAYYHQMKDDTKKNILIYDLGGGTFDVAIVVIDKGNIDIKTIAGDTHLGGEDFDNRMVEVCVREIKKKLGENIKLDNRALNRLKIRCEKCKWHLSTAKSTDISIPQLMPDFDFLYKMERTEFEKINMHLFIKTLVLIEKVLNDAKMKNTDIEDVVVVGGSTKIPKIQEMLKKYFNDKPLNKCINPDEAVAYGAAIQASLKNGEEFINSDLSLIQDVAPFSLGILVKGNVFSVIIPKDTKLPTTQKKTFHTSEDNQTAIKIEIFEGEDNIARNNRLLGEFIITGIPPKPSGQESIELIMEVDSEGILNVMAFSKSLNNVKSGIAIKDHRGRIPPEELKILIQNVSPFI
jgi:L1 cell adhesion molecule like protein